MGNAATGKISTTSTTIGQDSQQLQNDLNTLDTQFGAVLGQATTQAQQQLYNMNQLISFIGLSPTNGGGSAPAIPAPTVPLIPSTAACSVANLTPSTAPSTLVGELALLGQQIAAFNNAAKTCEPAIATVINNGIGSPGASCSHTIPPATPSLYCEFQTAQTLLGTVSSDIVTADGHIVAGRTATSHQLATTSHRQLDGSLHFQGSAPTTPVTTDISDLASNIASAQFDTTTAKGDANTAKTGATALLPPSSGGPNNGLSAVVTNLIDKISSAQTDAIALDFSVKSINNTAATQIDQSAQLVTFLTA